MASEAHTLCNLGKELENQSNRAEDLELALGRYEVRRPTSASGQRVDASNVGGPQSEKSLVMCLIDGE